MLPWVIMLEMGVPHLHLGTLQPEVKLDGITLVVNFIPADMLAAMEALEEVVAVVLVEMLVQEVPMEIMEIQVSIMIGELDNILQLGNLVNLLA